MAQNEKNNPEILLTLEYADAYGTDLVKARRFTEEEKAHYAEWFRELGLVSIGEHINLDGVTWRDLPDRQSDGSFCGCNNSAWIITQEEWDAYLALNEERLAEKAEKERQAELAELRHELKMMERQGKLCKTREEASKAEWKWNQINNDGGEGYVPHYYTVAEYEYTTARIKELEEKGKTH